jgi:carbon monoxide dehydrogenase subunit G
VELVNSFSVPVPIDEAWTILTDVERIAPCMPGAELEEVEGEDYRGLVKVKVGPITAKYKGTARFISKDDAAHVAVLRAEGRDVRGQGNANATVTASLTSAGESTNVEVRTDLDISGKVAQFGRGVMADVSSNIIAQFVIALEADIVAAPPPPATASAASAAGSAPAVGQSVATNAGPRKIVSRPAEPVDLLGAMGDPDLTKLVAPALAFAVGLFVGGWVFDIKLRRRNAPHR